MYSTLEDLKELLPEVRLLELTDDEQEGEFIISPPNAPYKKVVNAIGEADNLIDSFLCAAYQVPFSAIIPKLVTDISANLAIYTLYTRSHDLDMPKGLIQRYDRFMELLKMLQNKKIKFPELVLNENQFLSSKTKADINFGNVYP